MKTKMFILIWMLSVCAYAQQIRGKVIKVSDGDTVTLLTDDYTQVKVRLFGIDCPEKNQDFGQKARRFVADQCLQKNVLVEKKGEDKYKRTLGIVFIDNVNLNELLLSKGLAWHYKFFSKSAKYAELEQQAKKNKINIWSQPNPIAPWDFRKK